MDFGLTMDLQIMHFQIIVVAKPFEANLTNEDNALLGLAIVFHFIFHFFESTFTLFALQRFRRRRHIDLRRRRGGLRVIRGGGLTSGIVGSRVPVVGDDVVLQLHDVVKDAIWTISTFVTFIATWLLALATHLGFSFLFNNLANQLIFVN